MPPTIGTVVFGENLATFQHQGSSRVVVARILGTEPGSDGEPERIWLDRLVHREPNTRYGEWLASGAISTILTRAPQGDAP